MSSKRYENAPLVTLSDYVPIDCFRTVLAEQRDIPCGITEIPVEMDLGKRTVGQLSFAVPWDGELYGFLRGKNALRQRLGTAGMPVRVAVSDWDGQCLMVIENERPQEETAFRVTTDEIVQLLEQCRRVPEQRRMTK